MTNVKLLQIHLAALMQWTTGIKIFANVQIYILFYLWLNHEP